MPLSIPFDFQHQHQFQQVGFVPEELVSPELVQWKEIKPEEAAPVGRFLGREPTSVLDSKGSPSPPNSSSFSSSASGGARTLLITEQPPCAAVGGVVEFDPSMFGFIWDDENYNDKDPSGLSKLISSAAPPLMPSSDLDSQLHHLSGDEFGSFCGSGSGQGTGFGAFGNIESLFSQQQQLQPQTIESLINQSHFPPSGSISYLPNPKRVNTGSFLNSDHPKLQSNLIEKTPFLDQRQVSALSGKIGMQPGGRKEEMGMQDQAVIEQIFKSAELVSMGNLVHAQGILARLNHQLSPIGKPLQRVAYYFKESLQLLLHMSSNDMDFNNGSVVTSAALANFSPPLSLILKLGAFKSFSEISPIVQFGNFTSIQAILEAVEMHWRIHVIDFDIGYGGQWASLMQELALRNCSGGTISLKVTAVVSVFDDLELQLARDNLNLFAEELNIELEFNVFGMDMLNSISHYVSHDEAIAVNLPIEIFSNCALSLPFVLRIVKQLSPKIVVSLERGCDRFDLPFARNVIQAFRTYSGLLESLEAVSGNSDTLQKIERFMIHPEIEKFILQRFRVQEKSPLSRSVFISSGYTPLPLSNFAESQGECLVERTPVLGFHIEKKHSSLILCWRQKELVSVSAWRC